MTCNTCTCTCIEGVEKLKNVTDSPVLLALVKFDANSKHETAINSRDASASPLPPPPILCCVVFRLTRAHPPSCRSARRTSCRRSNVISTGSTRRPSTRLSRSSRQTATRRSRRTMLTRTRVKSSKSATAAVVAQAASRTIPMMIYAM